MQDAIDFLLAKDTVFKTIIEKYGCHSLSASGF
jgi:hypothetical protein